MIAFDIFAAAGYGVRPNILVCQLATASSSTLPSQLRLAGGPGDSTGGRLCLLTPMGVARNIVGWLRETVFPLRRWTYPEPAHLS
jgi:hypothetical protein